MRQIPVKVVDHHLPGFVGLGSPLMGERVASVLEALEADRHSGFDQLVLEGLGLGRQ